MAICDNFDPKDRENPIITWAVGSAHPFVKDMKIVAMFISDDFIEIYSSDGNKSGMRELEPIRRVRFIREMMPFDVFVDELGNAERENGDEEEEDETEPETESPEINTNGQAPS